MFQILHIEWKFWITFGRIFGEEDVREFFWHLKIPKIQSLSIFPIYFPWLSLCFLWLRKSGLPFYSKTLHHLFYQKLFFHISPSEIQSFLQGQSQWSFHLRSFLHDLKTFFWTFIMLQTFLVAFMFCSVSCGPIYIILSQLLNDVLLWQRTGSYIFIVPWKSQAPCLAHNRGFKHMHLLFYFIPVLCLWEELLCIMESPGTKTIISLGSICNTVI